MKSKNGVNWGLLIVGILFIVASLVAFANPASGIYTLSFVFGLMAIISGVFILATQRGFPWRVASGIIDIICGLIMLFNLSATASVMPFIFAIWVIADSIGSLTVLGSVKNIMGEGYYILSLVLNILCIVAGVMMLFSPGLSALTVAFLLGFYLMLAGIESIVFAFNQI